MYHTETKKQAKQIKESFSVSGISHKYFHTDDIDSYISSCTPFQKDVASVFLKFQKAKSIKITNSFIARQIGCSTRTVTRATNKFHEDGFITKEQPNTYSTNHYRLNEKLKKGQYAFSHWLNSLSDTNKDLYISHGIIIDHKNKIICNDVIPNYNSLILDSLSRRPVPVLTSARETTQVFLKKQKGKIMNSVQKQLILKHRSDPKIKEILKTPSIRSEIITPVIEKISQLFYLEEKEQFKLIIYNDQALEYILAHAEAMVMSNKKHSVKNKMEWLIAVGNEFCRNNDTKPDWSWYYDVCDITGMSTKTEPKPLISKKPMSMYVPFKAPEQPPVNVRIEKLRLELKAHENNLENNIGPVYMMGILRRIIEQVKKELDELEELEDNDEKQNVLYKCGSHIMATCSS